jgi:hypothetical protein
MDKNIKKPRVLASRLAICSCFSFKTFLLLNPRFLGCKKLFK